MRTYLETGNSTDAERKRILVNNIYGVDIDPQAVEKTKLALLLIVLEGATEQRLALQLRFAHERALPDLDNNIKCGNSLIDDQFMGLAGLDPDVRASIRAFDWGREFEAIMRTGGFDAIMGNPPYIRIQTMQEWAPAEVLLYPEHYATARYGNYDKYALFVERSLQLLNASGRLGYILPHKFFNAQYGETLRDLIAEGRHLHKLVHFGHQQIFEGATTYTCLLFLNQQAGDRFEFSQVDDLSLWSRLGTAFGESIRAQEITSGSWNFVIGASRRLLDKLDECPTKLSTVAERIFQGLVTSSDPVYLLEPQAEEHDGLVKVLSRATGKIYELETEVTHSLCKGARDVRRYLATPSKRVIFPYDPTASALQGRTVLIPPDVFAECYPRAWAYLMENSTTLRGREKGKMDHDKWYGYVYPKSISLFAQPKILTPSIAARASYTLDARGELYFVGSGGGGGGGYGITLKSIGGLSYEYLLGLLNSRLLDYAVQQINAGLQWRLFCV